MLELLKVFETNITKVLRELSQLVGRRKNERGKTVSLKKAERNNQC